MKMLSFKNACLIAVLATAQATKAPHTVIVKDKGADPYDFHYYRKLASTVGATVTSQYNQDHNQGPGRKLQWSRSDFRNNVCDPYTDGFREGAPGSTCSCLTDTFSIDCTLPRQCDLLADCDGEEVCATVSLLVDFTEERNSLSATSVTLEVSYSGAAEYEGQRAVVTENSCAQFWTLDGLEYKCNSCSLCGGEGVNLDCTNIQSSADSSIGCFEVTNPNENGVNEGAFQLCPDGGAPLPTTMGLEPSSSAALTRGVSLGSAAAFIGLLVLL